MFDGLSWNYMPNFFLNDIHFRHFTYDSNQYYIYFPKKQLWLRIKTNIIMKFYAAAFQHLQRQLASGHYSS